MEKKLTTTYYNDNHTDCADLSDRDNGKEPTTPSSNGNDEDDQYKSEVNDDKSVLPSSKDNQGKDEGGKIYNKKTSEKYLTIDRCVSIVKAVELGVDEKEICEMFRCSVEQIKQFLQTRNNIKEFYKVAGNTSRPLGLEERMNVIKTYHRYKLTYDNLSYMFNCSRLQIEKTILNRNRFIDDYKRWHPDFDDFELRAPPKHMTKALTLDERIDVLKAFYRNFYSCFKLSRMFNCSKAQIKNILFNSRLIIEEYKKQHPDFVENDFNKKTKKSKYLKTLTLETCAEVIISYDNDKNYSKLARLYNCSISQIKSIIENRKPIMKTYQIYQNSGRQLNNVESNTSKSNIESEKTFKNFTNDITSNVDSYVENISPTLKTDKIVNIKDDAILKDEDFAIQHEKTQNDGDKINDNYKLSDISRKPNSFCNNAEASDIRSNGNLEVQTQQSENSDVSKITIDSSAHGDNENIILSHDNTPCWDKLNPIKCIKVIEAHDQNNSITKLASRFNCSEILINDIIKNRLNILKLLKSPVKTELSLYKRIDIIRRYICDNCSYHKLSRKFKCSLNEIQFCIKYREYYIKKYKKQHLDQKRVVDFGSKAFTLEERVKLIKAFDQYSDAVILGHWFGCRPTYIIKIVENRDGIIKAYQTLKPIRTYATLTHNSTAINIMLELEEHLPNLIPEFNHEHQTNFKVYSYVDAFNALKPIGDFAKLTSNTDAKDKLIQLGVHLVKNVYK